MRTCRQSQLLPAAARPAAQKQRAPRLRQPALVPIARNRRQNRLPVSEPPLRRAPPPKLHRLQRAPRLRARKQAPRQPPHARLPLLLQQPVQQTGWLLVVRRLLNRRLAARGRQHPHRAAHLPRSRARLRPAHLPGQPADLPREVQPHSAARLTHQRPGPRIPHSPAHRRSARGSRSEAGQRAYPELGHSKEAMGSAPAAPHILSPDAPQIEGHRRTPRQRVRLHPRTGRRKGASSQSKRRSRDPFPSRRRASSRTSRSS